MHEVTWLPLLTTESEETESDYRTQYMGTVMKDTKSFVGHSLLDWTPIGPYDTL